MAILRYLPGATILENNIVQTVASRGGDAGGDHLRAARPGHDRLVAGLPVRAPPPAITVTGGMLGVMFSVPLRRALVVDTRPALSRGPRRRRGAARSARAAARARRRARAGCALIVVNALVSAGFAILTQTKLVAAEAARWFRVGAGATGISGGLSFALIGAGHLVGLSVGMAMFAGMVIGWWIAAADPDRAPPPRRASVEAWADGVFRTRRALLRRGRDRRRGDLDAAQDRRPGGRRHPLGDRRVSARERGGAVLALERARPADRHRRRGVARDAGADRLCCSGR